MKKIFYFVAVVIASISVVSCKDTTLPLEYDVEATAVVNGHVVFGTPVGDFTMNGNGEANWTSRKDTTNYAVPTFGAVLNEPDDYSKKLVKFAEEVNASSWCVKESTGDVQVDAVGYVKEPNTGLILAIDFHWPNQPNEVEVVVDTVNVVK